ncbi:MAG: UDP-N-acetylmuramoyl-L-alanine--D-glutamate ligase [Anaerolineae bacterium]|nr:UDP-N-acetylmuramoyl-L-alanine--D-glutamate ligase [Anaerolineae bacterium]
MTNDPLYRKRVVVLGFGRQGRALARWLPTVGARVVVSDQNTPEEVNGDLSAFGPVEFVFGSHPDSLLDDADLVCISGGVPLSLPIIQEAVRRDIPLSNDAQLFLERCPAPTIGITGSAGKTTTTTLVGEMLKRTARKTWIGGNIGDVLLDVLPQIQPDHQVVIELSSFQLELMTASPHIGAVLNITPNHLDRHGTMERYTRAKAQILLHQSQRDIAVLARDDPGSRQLEVIAPGELAWFSGHEMVTDGAFLAGQRLLTVGCSSSDGLAHVVCEREAIHLRGEHNVLNVLAACAIAGAAGASAEVMAQTIREFRGVAHRLEVVRVLAGVTYVNDSIATAPERVLAALRSYDEPLVLLAGGKDKNLPWEEMLTLALQKARHIVAFGHVGDQIVEKVRALSGSDAQVTRVETLAQAVEVAVEVARPGDVVLLSPGGTSYDAYVDFVERGEHFRQLVMGL